MADNSESQPWSAQEATEATKSDIEEYIRCCLTTYDEERVAGIELFEFWKMDFANFTVATYKKTTEASRALRDFLRCHNVFIPKNRLAIGQQLLISTALPWSALPADQQWELASQPQQQQQREGSSHQQQPAPIMTQNTLVTLTKLYNDEQKYGGDPDDSFDLKFHIFEDLCGISKVADLSRPEAFKIMLKGTALTYYYTIFTAGRPVPALDMLRRSIKDNFEGSEHKQAMLAKWNTLTLQQAVDQEENKNVEKALQNLITELRKTQAKLDLALQTDAFLQAKLLSACRDHKSCQIACSIPSINSIELTNKLRSNVITWKAQQASQINMTEESYFTDRRFHGRPPYQRNNNSFRDSSSSSRRDITPSRSSSLYSPRYPPRPAQLARRKICFVCRREGCWSTKHTPEERQQAKDRFRQAYQRDGSRRFMTEPELNAQLEQYIVDSEGKADDEIDDLVNEFEAFLARDDAEPDETFMTECGPVLQQQALSLAQQLQQNAAVHALLKSDQQAPQYEAQQEQFYAATRYDSETFQGILIDTGAAGFSTAGSLQLKAYENLFGRQQINRSQQVTIKFGMGKTQSLGAIEI